MIFQCSDLERALRTPELMPEMRAHAAHCEACSRQLYLWAEISRLAPELHREWESPLLWEQIRTALAEVARPRPAPAVWAAAAAWFPDWFSAWLRGKRGLVLAAVAAVLLAVTLEQPWRIGPPRASLEPSSLLTETALQEVRQAEAAYTRSINKLSALTAADLQQSPSPLAAAYRDKLLLLDSAIADLKANVESNRYNTYLQLELASLYQAKQRTLQEWLQERQRNEKSN